MNEELLNRTEQDGYQLVIFSLGNENYATLISHVREVITPQSYTRIPESPDYIEGVINLRGSIIPVINGRKKFNLEPIKEKRSIEQRIMIIDTEDGAAGLIVDNVYSVAYLKAENIEQPPVDIGEDNEIFWGIGKYQDKLLILINCYKSLSLNKEIKDFKNITEIVKRSQNDQTDQRNT